MERIKTENISRAGGCFCADIEIGYQNLVDILGEPNIDVMDCKTDAEWLLEFDETSFCIYNWKNGENYLGKDGTPVNLITNWNIGGRDKAKAKELAEYLLNLPEK